MVKLSKVIKINVKQVKLIIFKAINDLYKLVIKEYIIAIKFKVFIANTQDMHFINCMHFIVYCCLRMVSFAKNKSSLSM